MNTNDYSSIVSFISNGDISGHVLGKRFKIGRQIDCGSFGRIFSCTDLRDHSRPLVIKVSSSSEIETIGKEIKALKAVSKYAGDSVPEVVSSGIIVSNMVHDLDSSESESADEYYNL